MSYFLLLVGFVLLVKGADFFVSGSSSLARILRIPSVVIGLTIVAMGTSAPEAAVSITASLTGNNGIAVGNILGSNLFNLLFIVGICALIRPFAADRSIVKLDLPVSLAAAGLLVVFIWDGRVVWWEGLLLIVCMAAYLTYTVLVALRQRKRLLLEEGSEPAPAVDAPKKPDKWWKSLLFMVGGLAAVVFGGDLVVDHASKIAVDWGMSQNLVGLTIVAVGTSLPELVTSIVAARKGDSGLALGNVVGSNIFNILFILGASACVSPLLLDPASFVDTVVLIGATAVSFLWYLFAKKGTRWVGAVSVLLYLSYAVYICLR